METHQTQMIAVGIIALYVAWRLGWHLKVLQWIQIGTSYSSDPFETGVVIDPTFTPYPA